MQKLNGFIIALLCLILPAGSFATVDNPWEELATGFEYLKLPLSNINPSAVLYAFRINLKYYQLDLALAKDQEQRSATVRDLALKNNALLAVNGGFFSPDDKVLGLRIKDAKQRNPLRPITWWGVFYVQNNSASIVSQRQFQKINRHGVDVAIQAGPRLIVNKRIPSLKPGIADRTAVCINSKGRVIIIATKNAFITTTELARIMLQPVAQRGLGCRNALNLDGGRSSQLYADFNNFNLSITNFSSITDALIVKAK